MTVNLAWRNAVAETNAHMNREEFEAGFAERLSNHVIAHLQVNNHRHRSIPLTEAERFFGTTEWRLVQAMRQQLEADCKAGAVPWVPWSGICQESDYYMIAAPDFAAWLASQGMEPSQHIAAWFAACKVGGTAQAGETITERNARWLLVWDKISLDHAPGSQAEAIRAIAATTEGAKADTVKAALRSADTARKERYRLTGVTPIKRGKNTANDPFNTLKPKARKSR